MVGTRSKKFPGIDRPDEFKEFEDFLFLILMARKSLTLVLCQTMHRDNPNRGDLKDHFDKFSFEYTQNTTGKSGRFSKSLKYMNCLQTVVV